MAQSSIVLFDYSNLAHRCLLSKAGMQGWKAKAFEEMFDFISLINSSEKYCVDEVVVALDSKDGYWRKDWFAPYKANRKEKRSKNVDWDEAFRQFDAFADSIDEHLPWNVLRVSKCEADDIIFAISDEAEMNGMASFIYSSDSDYIMLADENIMVFNPLGEFFYQFPCTVKIGGSEAVVNNAGDYLKYAVLTGQGGKDNVYNVRTPTDFEGARKPGFGVAAAKKLLSDASWMKELVDKGWFQNYLRNDRLINPASLPEQYRRQILSEYEKMPKHTHMAVEKFLPEIGSRLDPLTVYNELKFQQESEGPMPVLQEAASDFSF